jgi:iron(III) transport system ATP-binding protein
VQAARPGDLYHDPIDEWVAGFLGDADFFTGHASSGRVTTPVGIFPSELEGSVRVMIRPESVVLSPNDSGSAVVRQRQFFGHDQLVTVTLQEGQQIRARLGPTPYLEPGDPVSVSVRRVTTFPVSGGPTH